MRRWHFGVMTLVFKTRLAGPGERHRVDESPRTGARLYAINLPEARSLLRRGAGGTNSNPIPPPVADQPPRNKTIFHPRGAHINQTRWVTVPWLESKDGTCAAGNVSTGAANPDWERLTSKEKAPPHGPPDFPVSGRTNDEQPMS